VVAPEHGLEEDIPVGLRTTGVAILLALALGAIGAWALKPDPPPVYREVEVPVEVIREVERVDTVVQWRERIRYVEREPETVAVAIEGAVGLVESFCAGLGIAETDSGGDPISPARPILLLRSVRVDDPFWGASTAVFTGPRSSGDLAQFRYTVRGDWQAAVRHDGMLVQSDRFWWLEPAIKGAGLLAVGYGLGTLLGR